MNTQIITINKVQYKVKFGIKSNIILGKMWNITKLSKIGEKLSKLNFKDNQEPTMQQMLAMSQLVLSGILSKQKNAEVDEDDVFEFITQNPADTSKLMELYTSSLARDNSNTSKNVNPDQRK
ncbi:hypothetical protein ACFQ5N_02180 [Lutibacter holmesii]|uniref:Uncharacterized protein n=1 Tax=Lutibacter holmesii TaxID=1137985 RepID=A0ABW3WL76_9FLAO